MVAPYSKFPRVSNIGNTDTGIPVFLDILAIPKYRD
jgi:hypothetical protein